MTKNILIAGFGGQGVLFTGKFIAYGALIEGKELSWLPSYGPEMRGGTCNCSVIVSDEPVGSPIVNEPDVLIAMNRPSLDKFEDAVVPGGDIYIDSSLVDREVRRTDVNVHYIPATRLSTERGFDGIANMILLGSVIKGSGVIKEETIPAAMSKVVSAKRQNLFDFNIRALALGAEVLE
ncbi:MAG: 2-oxoacid:acceptor oxidoreductase family protein [Clostridia bacterium]|nr:2-oxoacid:acceptor oxidoreductase family protein [Clostridia bacterium]